MLQLLQKIPDIHLLSHFCPHFVNFFHLGPIDSYVKCTQPIVNRILQILEETELFLSDLSPSFLEAKVVLCHTDLVSVFTERTDEEEQESEHKGEQSSHIR